MIIKVEGGSSAAMVSDNFKIEGSLRAFSVVSYEKLKKRIIDLT